MTDFKCHLNRLMSGMERPQAPSSSSISWTTLFSGGAEAWEEIPAPKSNQMGGDICCVNTSVGALALEMLMSPPHPQRLSSVMQEPESYVSHMLYPSPCPLLPSQLSRRHPHPALLLLSCLLRDGPPRPF